MIPKILYGASAIAMLSSANGFLVQPRANVASTTQMQMNAVDRRAALKNAFGAIAGVSFASVIAPSITYADGEAPAAPAAPAADTKKDIGPFPKDWGIKKSYYDDASTVVRHMRYVLSMDKTSPDFEQGAKNCKKEMTDFVSYYRRFDNVAGKPSFNTLYTAINVLAGHYVNYGTKFPVPEKRKKRLFVELNDVEKNIKRQR